MTTWSAADAFEADPADVAEQRAPADADDPTGVVDPVEEVGEADPADVREQAIEVAGDESYDRG
jgi:hypothetical protein